MRSILNTFIVVAIFSFSAIAVNIGRASSAKNIILIGWDGAQREHIQQSMERGELPTLKMLSKEGALVDIDIVTGATDTKAGWSQILTGYSPTITGVYSNDIYQDVPKGLSVFERFKKYFGRERFVCVAVIGKSEHCGEINPPYRKRLNEETALTPPLKPPAVNLIDEEGLKYLVFNGSPYYTMHKSCDVWEYGLNKDVKVGKRVLQLLNKYKDTSFFFFVHFAEVDHSGHRHGENSKQYNDALISNDRWTGNIITKLKELGLYDKTLVYVTSDHGFDESKKSHKYAPFVFLGTNDPKVMRAGLRQDIAPTILTRFGIDLSQFKPPLDGESLTQPPTKPVLKAPEKRNNKRQSYR